MSTLDSVCARHGLTPRDAAFVAVCVCSVLGYKPLYDNWQLALQLCDEFPEVTAGIIDAWEHEGSIVTVVSQCEECIHAFDLAYELSISCE